MPGCNHPAEFFSCVRCGAQFCEQHQSEVTVRNRLPYHVSPLGSFEFEPLTACFVEPPSLRFCKECLGLPEAMRAVAAYAVATSALEQVELALLEFPAVQRKYGRSLGTANARREFLERTAGGNAS